MTVSELVEYVAHVLERLAGIELLSSVAAGEIRTCAYDHTTRADELSDHAAGRSLGTC